MPRQDPVERFPVPAGAPHDTSARRPDTFARKLTLSPRRLTLLPGALDAFPPCLTVSPQPLDAFARRMTLSLRKLTDSRRNLTPLTRKLTLFGRDRVRRVNTPCPASPCPTGSGALLPAHAPLHPARPARHLGLVVLSDRLHLEAGLLHRSADLAGPVATAHHPPPHPLDPPRPCLRARLRRPPMLEIDDLPARLQNSAQLAQHPGLVVHRAQRVGRDHSVEALILEGNGLAPPCPDIRLPALLRRFLAREIEQLGPGIDPREPGHP